MTVKLDWQVNDDESDEDALDWLPETEESSADPAPAPILDGLQQHPELLPHMARSRADWENPNVYLFLSLMVFATLVVMYLLV